LVDLLTYLIFFAICFSVKSLRRWLWLNLVIIGMVSPLVNSVYNYQAGFWRPASDVAVLLAALPDLVVHLYFAATIVAYIAGLYGVFRYSRMASREG
jgi:multidrug efflux pump subunit AcrA (membrane-fusion protein)